MTLQQNILLYNFLIFITLPVLAASFLILAFIGKISFVFSFILLSAAAVSFVIFRKLELRILSFSKSELEREEEKINLLSERIAAKKKALSSLPQIQQRASFLFDASQKLIELADREEIYDFLITSLGELFPQADSILFFGFNKEKDSLSLLRSLKRKHSVIKEKKGGVLDKWVLHHNRSLLIEDLTKDFRFDYNKIEAYTDRRALAFIISPLSVGRRRLGIIRIEGGTPSIFTIDGLRFLRNICDFGTVVLERVNLFINTGNLAIKDFLTSTYLKGYFFERLAEERKRPCNEESRIGIIMLDIDNFKEVNDTYGHVVGDLVLKKLAKILTGVAGGAGNIICRFGGEEFIISAAESSKKEVLFLGEEIRRRVEESELAFRRKKINFTVSLGAVLCSGQKESAEELVARVDKLLYKAKREGKNRLCFSE